MKKAGILALLLVLALMAPACLGIDRIVIGTYLGTACTPQELIETTLVRDEVGCQSAISFRPGLLSDSVSLPSLHYVFVAAPLVGTGEFTIFEQEFDDFQCTGFLGLGSPNTTVQEDTCTLITSYQSVNVTSAPVAISQALEIPANLQNPEISPVRVAMTITGSSPGILEPSVTNATASFDVPDNSSTNAFLTQIVGPLDRFVAGNVTLQVPPEVVFDVSEIFWNVSAVNSTSDCVNTLGFSVKMALQFFDFLSSSPGEMTFTYRLAKVSCNTTAPTFTRDELLEANADWDDEIALSANISFTVARFNQTFVRFALNDEDNVLAWAETLFTISTSGLAPTDNIMATLSLTQEVSTLTPAPITPEPITPITPINPEPITPIPVAPPEIVPIVVVPPVTVSPPIPEILAPIEPPPIAAPTPVEVPIAPVVEPTPIAPVVAPVPVLAPATPTTAPTPITTPVSPSGIPVTPFTPAPAPTPAPIITNPPVAVTSASASASTTLLAVLVIAIMNLIVIQ